MYAEIKQVSADAPPPLDKAVTGMSLKVQHPGYTFRGMPVLACKGLSTTTRTAATMGSISQSTEQKPQNEMQSEYTIQSVAQEYMIQLVGDIGRTETMTT